MRGTDPLIGFSDVTETMALTLPVIHHNAWRCVCVCKFVCLSVCQTVCLSLSLPLSLSLTLSLPPSLPPSLPHSLLDSLSESMCACVCLLPCGRCMCENESLRERGGGLHIDVCCGERVAARVPVYVRSCACECVCLCVRAASVSVCFCIFVCSASDDIGRQRLRVAVHPGYFMAATNLKILSLMQSESGTRAVNLFSCLMRTMHKVQAEPVAVGIGPGRAILCTEALKPWAAPLRVVFRTRMTRTSLLRPREWVTEAAGAPVAGALPSKSVAGALRAKITPRRLAAAQAGPATMRSAALRRRRRRLNLAKPGTRSPPPGPPPPSPPLPSSLAVSLSLSRSPSLPLSLALSLHLSLSQ